MLMRKLVQDGNNVTNWITLNDKALTKEEMIKLLNDNGYQVSGLNDIDSNDNLKYELVIKYRNRK